MIHQIQFRAFIFSFLFLLLFGNISHLAGQDYLWPTNASTLMTSSFCEFRPRHYHAAIDIKTWAQTGYKTFAIADGYVMRVRVSAFGYGKAVYLKLNDGNIVVYAHLKRFWPALERYVDNYRKRNETYRADIHLKSNQFPVSRGQIIGYTGRTGIGVPHLHFEIRNKHNKPINPLPYYKNVLKDDIEPELYQAAFMPLNQNSLINFKTDTVRYDLNRKTNYSLGDTLYIQGKVGLLLKVYDRANGARNLFSFYKADMFIDDSLVYTVKYDSFSYARTSQIELDKNFSLWRQQQGIFHNFYRHPANQLPHYPQIPKNGGILASETMLNGLHHLRIEIEDFWQNHSEFEAYFISGEAIALEYDLYRWLDEILYLRIQSPKELENIKAYYPSNPGYKLLKKVEILGHVEHNDIHHYAMSIPASKLADADYIKLQGITQSEMSTMPLFLPLTEVNLISGSNSYFQVQNYQLKKNWLELTVRTERNKPFKILNKLDKNVLGTFWFPMKKKQYQIHLPAAYLARERTAFDELFGESLPNIQPVKTGEQNKIESPDKNFEASFPPDALYEDAGVYVTQTDSLPAAAEFEAPYQRFMPIYDLQPFDIPVNKGVWVSLRVPDSLRDAKGLGIYYLDKKNGWNYIPSNWDSEQNKFSTRVTSLEKFTLAQDTIPPEVIPAQQIKKNKLSSRNGYLTFVVQDEMTGIRRESQIEVFINGNWHLFEFDPEEDFISVKVPKGKTSNLKVRVTDNVGNITEKTYLVE